MGQQYINEITIESLFLLVLISISTAFLSIVGNIYFHELGHYYVAENFNLNPSMHFTTPTEVDANVFSFILSRNFKAYVQFDVAGSDFQNLMVTLGGPLVNLLLFIFGIGIYFFGIKKLKKNLYFFKRHFWLVILLDVIIISFLVPSILSFVVNMLPISGSDGSAIYSIFLN